MIQVVLLDAQGELISKHEIIGKGQPEVVQLDDRYFVYSHDALVGAPKVRAHYFKETTLCIIHTNVVEDDIKPVDKSLSTITFDELDGGADE